MSLWTLAHNFLCAYMFSLVFGCIPTNEIVGSILNCLNNSQTAFQSAAPFYILPVIHEGSSFFISSNISYYLPFFFFFYYTHLSRGEVESHCSLICISLMTKWLMPKQPFMPFLQYIFFGEMFIQIFSTLLTVSTFYYWEQIHFYKFLNTQQKKQAKPS